MKALYKVLVVCLLLSTPTAYSQIDIPPSIQFQKALGGSNQDIGYSVVKATDGNYVIAGTVLSTIET